MNSYINQIPYSYSQLNMYRTTMPFNQYNYEGFQTPPIVPATQNIPFSSKNSFISNDTFVPSQTYNSTLLNNVNQTNSISKLGTRVINGKSYSQYKLQNGTTVLIHSNPYLSKTNVSTSINVDNRLFSNATEAHIFEHMLLGDKLCENVGFNKGYFYTVDDGEQGNQVRFNLTGAKNENVASIVNDQVNHIYNTPFAEKVFNREKQALNIELASKQNAYGNRNEIDSLDLNHLREIRNIMIKPNNLEIIVEGNVNPDILAQQISKTQANKAANNVRKLPMITYDKIQSVSKDTPENVVLKSIVVKPQKMDDAKFQASLEIIRLLALFSDKMNFNERVRTLCYGPDIRISKMDNMYFFNYDNVTLPENANSLLQESKNNLTRLKNNNFTENDLNNAKNYIKNCPKYMLSSYLQNVNLGNIIDDVTLEDLQTVIDSIKV